MYERKIWDYLTARLPPVAAAGVMGNLYAESGLNPRNLQNTGNARLGMTDDEYTEAVDCGRYKGFVDDGWGYGLAQWTYSTRKAGLLDAACQRAASVGHIDVQLDYLWRELQAYTGLMRALQAASTVREASDAVLTMYERPADQSEAVRARRAAFGQLYLDQYNGGVTMVFEPDYGKKYIESTGTHYIANSGSDENKSYTGGKAGDQTGHEAELKKWYNRPWSVVLRYPDQAVGLTIAQEGVAMCLNDKVGYDQNQRTTYWTQLKAAGYDPRKITTACEEDCTAGVSANVRAAGYIHGIVPLQDVPICSSRNMRAQFTKAGFVALTASKYLTSPDNLLPGDILLYENHHAATNITIGKNVREQWFPDNAPTTPVRPTTPDDPEPSNTPADVTPPCVTITGPSVNIRSGPSADYPSMAVVHAGDRLHYFGHADPASGWLLVEYERATGWVSPKYAEVEV